MLRLMLRVCAPVAAVVALALIPSTAGAAGEVHPGVQTFTDGAQCPANFIFRDAGGTYIGQAAHCSVTGATKPGTLVYNSWITMQGAGEKDADTCAYNDLALVKLDPADVGRVDPTVPGWGGPTG